MKMTNYHDVPDEISFLKYKGEYHEEEYSRDEENKTVYITATYKFDRKENNTFIYSLIGFSLKTEKKNK